MSNRKATPIGILTITALTTLMIAAPSAAAQVAADFSPGSEIKNRTASKNCTAGWTGSIDGKEGFLTSGHCGSVGDVFYDSNGALIGTMTHDMDARSAEKDGDPDIGFIELDSDVNYRELPEGLPSTTIVDEALSVEEFDFPGMAIVGKSGKNTGKTHQPYSYSLGTNYFLLTDAQGFAISGDSGAPMYIYSKDKRSVYPIGTLRGSIDFTMPSADATIRATGVTMNYAEDVWGFQSNTSS